MKEIWKEIPGFPGYEVSNLGQVRSYFYRAEGEWKIAENPQRILCFSLKNNRYRGVNLRHDGKSYNRTIGRLVLLAFVGPPPNDMEMCHNDGDPSNDQLGNLRYDTHNANMQDALRHGWRRNSSKLNQEEVCAIRTKFASGRYSKTELAEEFELSYSLICHVITGQGAYKGGPGLIQIPHTRLTDQQAEAIRLERASGESLNNLAGKYGISISGISRIALGNNHGKAAGPCVQPYEIISSCIDLNDEHETMTELQGNSWKHKFNVWIYCACGCGEIRLKYNRGKSRRFIQGHR